MNKELFAPALIFAMIMLRVLLFGFVSKNKSRYEDYVGNEVVYAYV